MPLDPRFLHWLQAADEKLFYTVGELRVEVDDTETEEAATPPESYDEWEDRARMIAAANAALRAEEESQWSNS